MSLVDADRIAQLEDALEKAWELLGDHARHSPGGADGSEQCGHMPGIPSACTCGLDDGMADLGEAMASLNVTKRRAARLIAETYAKARKAAFAEVVQLCTNMAKEANKFADQAKQGEWQSFHNGASDQIGKIREAVAKMAREEG